MAFLKVIVAIAIAVLLVIFLNVTMAKIFPTSTDYSRGQKCYDHAPYKLYPQANEQNAVITPQSQSYKDAQTKYDKCVKDSADESALSNIYSWVRSVIILLIIVTISVFLFKKFPFFSSALIGGGLIFAISYPLFSSYGYNPSSNLSAGIQNQVDIIKIITTLVGCAALSVADLLFFEKEHAGQPKPLVAQEPIV